MIRFEKNDAGTIVLITDDAQAELAYLDDAEFGGVVPAFDDAVLDNGEMRLSLEGLDTEDMEEVVGIVVGIDREAGKQLEALAF